MSERRDRRVGPWVLLLPMLALSAGICVLLFRDVGRGRSSPPAATDPDESVDAFVARVPGRDGGRLVARLAPLHADPQRAAFEAGALQERFDLAEGEAWRLTVRWEGGLGADDSPALSAERGRARSALGLGPVSVTDADGTALESLPAPPPADGAPIDPLRALLAPPAGPLRPGEEVAWVLWGRGPRTDVRLEGLLPPPGAEGADDFEAATGLAGPVEFTLERVRRRELFVPLARLERGGKNGRLRASGGGGGTSTSD